jgi:hypothetical protein
MKIIFRLILLGDITIIVTAFYMRVYCHDHTSLSSRPPNSSLGINFIKPSKILRSSELILYPQIRDSDLNQFSKILRSSESILRFSEFIIYL